MTPRTLTQKLLLCFCDVSVFVLMFHFINHFTVSKIHPFSHNIALNLFLFLGCLFLTNNYNGAKADFFLEFIDLLQAFLVLYLFYIVSAVTLDSKTWWLSMDYYAKFTGVFLLFTAISRLVLRWLLYRIKFLRQRVLIYGAGEMGEILVNSLMNSFYLNYQLIGLLDDDPEKHELTLQGIQVLGGSEKLEEIAKSKKIDRVIVAIPTLSRDRIFEILLQFSHLDIDVEVVPDLFRIVTPKIRLISGIPLVSTRIQLVHGIWAGLKRILDIVGAIVALLLFSPIMAVAAIMIRMESPGPALFCQDRLGCNGRTFRLWKFRSMFVDAEEKLSSLLAENEAMREEYAKFAKLSDDPRITRVGRFIRKWSIDEFPQLFNVLTGDLSLVGPRPYLVSELDKMGEFGDTILQVKPGVTGLWQIRGRNELTFRERLRLEAFYVRRWSPWLDLWILLSTIPVVLFRRGAK